ncbi:MAG: prepilin-type N-terminal cleavage/methylation domain-containing protein [Nitrospirae bacterium]|nr:prepilin-type N-terminal cleavage/methylation domain-containing protein [Nitrospirota bacterium]
MSSFTLHLPSFSDSRSSAFSLQPSAFSPGFTLLELVLVIFIISLTTALILPSFWDTGERALKSEARRLSSTLRYVYDEAVGKKQTFLLKFNLEDNNWGYESEKDSRSFKMEKDVTFRDVVIPSHGELTAGELTIEFGPLGPAEPITVHLIKDRNEYTVTFNHLNGRVKIFEGYVMKAEG